MSHRPAIVSLLLAAALLLGAAGAQGQPRVNPHGETARCASCHAPTAEGTPPEQMVWTGGDPDSTCHTCHDWDPHQVGLEPVRTKAQPIMLLNQGRIACFSCHDEPSCDGSGIMSADPYHFRGGPYDSQGELCARCHEVSGNERFNPHQAMVEGDRGEVCEHCHLVTPDPEDDSADLKVAGPNICLGCHPENVHVGSAVHLGPLDGDMVRSVADAGLPLHEGGEVVCVTCHDPHPSVVKSRTHDRSRREGMPLFPADWREQVLDPAIAERIEGLGARIEPVTLESDYLRLPLDKGELCRVCHDSAGIETMRRADR